MSTPYTQADVAGNLMYQWASLLSGDVGDAAVHAGSADRSVQFAGTFSGAVATLEGSLDAQNWFTLHDTQGVSLAFNAAGLRLVLENAVYIRPRVTGGDGTTNVAAILAIRR